MQTWKNIFVSIFKWLHTWRNRLAAWYLDLFKAPAKRLLTSSELALQAVGLDPTSLVAFMEPPASTDSWRMCVLRLLLAPSSSLKVVVHEYLAHTTFSSLSATDWRGETIDTEDSFCKKAYDNDPSPLWKQSSQTPSILTILNFPYWPRWMWVMLYFRKYAVHLNTSGHSFKLGVLKVKGVREQQRETQSSQEQTTPMVEPPSGAMCNPADISLYMSRLVSSSIRILRQIYG